MSSSGKRSFTAEHILQDLKEKHIDAVYQQRHREGSGNQMSAGHAKRRAMQLEAEIRRLEYGY